MIWRIRQWHSFHPQPAVGYGLAVLLAAVAQVMRLPLHPSTLMPYITYVPFMLLGAALGGFGPGVLVTAICVLESTYFAMEPLRSFKVSDPQLWPGLGAMALTGIVASWLFESLKRAWRSVANVTHELGTRTQMLESIFEHSPVSMALLRGPEFKFAMINPSYQDLRPDEPIIGRALAELWPAAAPVMLPKLKAARDAQTIYHVEGRPTPAQPADGLPAKELFFDVSYVPLPGPGERETQVLVCALDVTKRKRDEMALRDAYAQLAAIHAQVPAAILVIDERLHVEQANEMASRFFRRPVSGAILDCLTTAADADWCGHGQSCEQCPLRLAIVDTLASGTPHDGIELWLDGDAFLDWRGVLASTTALQVNGASKVLLCAQDITERKEAEIELSQQRDELQRQARLINLSHDAIITVDTNRVIRSWNRGAEETYGWTEAEAVGKAIHLLLCSRYLDSVARVNEILSRETEWDGEIEHTRRDGVRILVESRQVLVRDGSDAGVRILEINRDVTDRRRAEEALNVTVRQLEAAVAEKTVLLQEIHHRVKNNLAVTASLLSMKADGCGPEARLALEESQKRVHSIALVHEHLYRCDHLDHINLGQYARELAQDVYCAFSGDSGHVRLDFQLDPIEVGIERAVPCALILNELLSNAFKYAFADGRAGRVLVSLRQSEPGWCEMEVEDNGVGLPAGTIGGEGKSLGLRIVGILTRQLDGSIEQRDGPGTRIVLRFPSEPRA